jgi:serine/threonine protein kinase
MAPEVFGVDNMAYTNSADVYSFAMVFFEVLTGEYHLLTYSGLTSIKTLK